MSSSAARDGADSVDGSSGDVPHSGVLALSGDPGNEDVSKDAWGEYIETVDMSEVHLCLTSSDEVNGYVEVLEEEDQLVVAELFPHTHLGCEGNGDNDREDEDTPSKQRHQRSPSPPPAYAPACACIEPQHNPAAGACTDLEAGDPTYTSFPTGFARTQLPDDTRLPAGKGVAGWVA
ncbi:hypothetical protein PTSG_03694 [Salpingoeca rosetta]|uniref:Uncharacterized protein n=1 Tax=Salpingoeca rosetta (strain ATCC 50818 / BSB-021) TaxID=946362 RepID=F2U6B5_SALR5|nr:uncharacterized protein PTSG_03694 [Salpingoeca rosetta]EGD83056.1 hypothetical protein PTSG_03694 [Salpingoeca rosetta]|eukprot:XP_004995420.1 hypothetical protein PTSG_03694 [Salpingoeca rosetta]